jgi:hypothetical protein
MSRARAVQLRRIKRTEKRNTLGMVPGWSLLRALQRMIPLRRPRRNSSSDGSSGRSRAATTPASRLSQDTASFLLKAAMSLITCVLIVWDDLILRCDHSFENNE